MTLTKEQRIALKRVYDRKPIYVLNTKPPFIPPERPITYREFRKTVHHGWDCIMVPWCGMWLGIEKDGYTHS